MNTLKQRRQIAPDKLLVKDLPGVAEALREMGAVLLRISGPFTPEQPYQPAHHHGPTAAGETSPAAPDSPVEVFQADDGAHKNGLF